MKRYQLGPLRLTLGPRHPIIPVMLTLTVRERVYASWMVSSTSVSVRFSR